MLAPSQCTTILLCFDADRSMNWGQNRRCLTGRYANLLYSSATNKLGLSVADRHFRVVTHFGQKANSIHA